MTDKQNETETRRAQSCESAPGRDVSITDVAEIAGVSIATVSRTLNRPDQVSETTRRKVEEAIEKTGYRPNLAARSLRKGRSNHFVVAIQSVGHPYLTELIRDIRAAAQVAGYTISVLERREGDLDTAEAQGIIAARQAVGIVQVGSNVSFVLLGAGVAKEVVALPAVTIDNFAAATDAIKYLIERGHRRVGMISGHRDSSVARQREAGFSDAMSNAGLQVEAGLIESGGYTIEGARQATQRLLRLDPRPTAIFCGSDEMAIGCIHEIKQAGLSVPGHVSVMGFDDVRYAEVSDPPLTTVRQPTAEIGARIVARLIAALTDAEPISDKTEIIRHELIERGSVARPPQ
ncbi:MAG: LacI family DNA-binding transcriptional regulator [Woeseiaceae bacterium]|nr:LacI family DNA-binding transcriptional regulator [Woeseiaceae bacterium]